MKYKLTVQKYIENPKFTEELADYKEKARYNNYSNSPYPSEFLATTSLEVELTEEEYKKVKGEVVKVFV